VRRQLERRHGGRAIGHRRRLVAPARTTKSLSDHYASSQQDHRSAATASYVTHARTIAGARVATAGAARVDACVRAAATASSGAALSATSIGTPRIGRMTPLKFSDQAAIRLGRRNAAAPYRPVRALP
jgi:hypothetical protein